MDSPHSILPLQVELSCIFDVNRLSDLLLGTGDSMARFKCLNILSVFLMPCLTLPCCSFIILVSAKDIKNSLFNVMLRHTHIYTCTNEHIWFSLSSDYFCFSPGSLIQWEFFFIFLYLSSWMSTLGMCLYVSIAEEVFPGNTHETNP